MLGGKLVRQVVARDIGGSWMPLERGVERFMHPSVYIYLNSDREEVAPLPTYLRTLFCRCCMHVYNPAKLQYSYYTYLASQR